MKKNLLSIITVFLFAIALHSQVTTSSIKWRITDTNQVTIAGVNILAVHTPNRY